MTSLTKNRSLMLDSVEKLQSQAVAQDVLHRHINSFMYPPLA